MLRPEALKSGRSGDPSIDLLKYPHNGVDPREYIKDTDIETGSAVIQMIQESYDEQGISFSTEDMVASAQSSLSLTDDEVKEIFPSLGNSTQIQETFIGLVYLGSLFGTNFGKAMRMEFPNHSGSHLDMIKNAGIKPVVGEFHRVLKGDTGGS